MADFKSENPANIVTSFGGLLFMICSFGLIAGVILLEAGPVYNIFMADLLGRNLSVAKMIWVAFSFLLAVFLCLLATFYPIYLGEKHLTVK